MQCFVVNLCTGGGGGEWRRAVFGKRTYQDIYPHQGSKKHKETKNFMVECEQSKILAISKTNRDYSVSDGVRTLNLSIEIELTDSCVTITIRRILPLKIYCVDNYNYFVSYISCTSYIKHLNRTM